MTVLALHDPVAVRRDDAARIEVHRMVELEIGLLDRPFAERPPEHRPLALSQRSQQRHAEAWVAIEEVGHRRQSGACRVIAVAIGTQALVRFHE